MSIRELCYAVECQKLRLSSQTPRRVMSHHIHTHTETANCHWRWRWKVSQLIFYICCRLELFGLFCVFFFYRHPHFSSSYTSKNGELVRLWHYVVNVQFILCGVTPWAGWCWCPTQTAGQNVCVCDDRTSFGPHRKLKTHTKPAWMEISSLSPAVVLMKSLEYFIYSSRKMRLFWGNEHGLGRVLYVCVELLFDQIQSRKKMSIILRRRRKFSRARNGGIIN